MPCLHPVKGYLAREVNPATGKRSIVYPIAQALYDCNGPVQAERVCGQCRYCRLEHSRQWAMRCFHEASLYERNCFLTLTYSSEFLPVYGSVDSEAPVLFMKRLRDRFGEGIRSYGCAEYGEFGRRPHYHICLFNFDFSDKKIFKRKNGFELFRSPVLEELWPFGQSVVSAFSFETAAYVARYVTKKISGPAAPSHYEVACDRFTGEIYSRVPERSVCVSRMPGLGKPWYERYGAFVRQHDFVVMNGRKVRPPKYYDVLFERDFPEQFREVKAKRKEGGIKAAEALEEESRLAFLGTSLSSEVLPRHRLSVIEDFEELKFSQLRRSFEDG